VPAALGVNDTLQPGVQYTFSFDAGAVHASFEEIDAALQYLTYLNQVTAVFDHGIVNDRLDVTGVYTGDGSDSVVAMVQQILNALPSGWLSGTYNYAGTRMGSTGAVEGNLTLPSLPAILSAGSSALWPILLLVLVAAFLFYGGGNVVKPLLKRVA